MDQPHTPGFAELQAAVGQLTETERETLIGHLQSRSGEAVTQDPDATQLVSRGGSGTDEDAPGSVIERYKILECIGEGGFGSVFVAEQSEPVRRRVALKILKRGMDTQRVVARFAAERQALAMMDHPNIAKVLDAGQTPSGRPFFAMELVQGETITDYCDQSRLSVAERIELVRTVCAGVQHAHQKGIIHRDLKPSNVLVAQQDGRPMPKIIDFGIAKAIRGRIGDETVYTQVHQMIGTPIYMSPEQTGASSLDVDTRTDIYSLGVLLYELLTGVTPFDQEKTRQLGLLEMQRLIVEDTPPRPSVRYAGLAEQKGLIAAKRGFESRRLGKALQGDLDWVVMKCLEKDRTRRYESAHALGEDLGRHLANEPVHAGRPSAGYLTRKFISRNRAQVAAGTAIVLLLVLGLGGTMVAWSRARDQSDRLRFTLDFFTRALAGGADEDSAIAIWQDNPELTLGQALRNAEGLIDGTFEGEPQLEAVIRELIGLAQLRGGEFDDAARQLARAVAARTTVFGESDVATLRLLLPLADAQSKAGDYQGSMATATRAYELNAAALGASHADSRAAALWLARWFAAAYHFDDAERYFDLATLRIEGVADTRDAITVAATIEGCGVLVSKGRLDRAEEILRSAAPTINALPESLETVKARFGRQLGMVLVLRGKYAEAIGLLGASALTTDAAGRVELGPDTDRYRARLLAWALAKSGRADESVALFEALLALERRAAGPAFREIFARIYFADALLGMGRAEEALAQIEPALQRYDAMDLPNDPDRLWALSILGRARLETGDMDGAGRVLKSAIETDGLFPEHRLYVPIIHGTNAAWLAATGDDEAARRELSAAVDVGRSVYGADHPLVQQMMARLD